MGEIHPEVTVWHASDRYPIHVKAWKVPAEVGTTKARILVLHGVQSHGGWYHRLGANLANLGYETHFTDRRGSGANREDRGHTSSTNRLLADVSEYLDAWSQSSPVPNVGLVGISWGGKLAVVTAGEQPNKVDALALICPGLHPKVGVTPGGKLQIAWAYLTQPRKTFPIPLSDPALFSDSLEAQKFIANDPLGLRAATASLLASSVFLDRRVARVPGRVRQPSLLMLADRDRIVDNPRTLAYWGKVGSKTKTVISYPEGHHTLEFDPDPDQYATDLARWFDQNLSRSGTDPGQATNPLHGQ